MAPSHPYESLRLPSYAPFALKPSPGKGWGAFATRDIKRGSTILREAPLFVIRKSYEDITEVDLRAAFQNLAPADKRRFSHIRDNGSVPFTTMSTAMAANSFALTGDDAAYGLFILLSRFNHSCLPNSRVPISGSDTLAMLATKDIATGEEIRFCYGTDFEYMCRHDRHQHLRFVCECPACLVGTPFQQLSDVRRTFLRALYYLHSGWDLDGQKPLHTSHFVIEPTLKKAAEDFSIPLSSRMIYLLLLIFFINEEGLLDDYTLNGLYQGVECVVSLVKTENNVKTAKLALEQKTWLGKLCVAFEMYGRADAADDRVAELYRKLQPVIGRVGTGPVYLAIS